MNNEFKTEVRVYLTLKEKIKTLCDEADAMKPLILEQLIKLEPKFTSPGQIKCFVVDERIVKFISQTNKGRPDFVISVQNLETL